MASLPNFGFDWLQSQAKEIVDDDKPLLEIMVGIPEGLKRRIDGDEKGVNSLQVGVVLYNNGLEIKPESGISTVIVFLKDEKMEYPYRIHSLSLETDLDLEKIEVKALVSTTDDKMVKRLMDDKVLSFYLSGKLVEDVFHDVERVTINRIVAHIDQTAYAKKYNKVKDDFEKKMGKVIDAQTKITVKDGIFGNKSLEDTVKERERLVKELETLKVAKRWDEVYKKSIDIKGIVKREEKMPDIEKEDKEFEDTKKLVKEKLKKG